jgi:hypothetical protein
MVDLSGMIFGALNGIGGVTVYYFSPSVWTDLPAVSCFEAQNAEYKRAGGQEYLSEILYQIEIWSGNRNDILRIAGELDARLAAMGMKREMSCDDVDSEHSLQHRKMQYGCIANRNGQLFQKNNNDKKE